MSRSLHKLSALRAGKEMRKGRHGDGGGLYLDIGAGGRRRWIFRFRDRESGRLRDMGLGSAATVSLAEARTKAAAARSILHEGNDPIALSKSASRTVPTFAKLTEEVVSSLEAGWRNAKHRAQWRSTLQTYAMTLAAKSVDEIGTDDVLDVLRPIWSQRPETASRVRGRVEKILDAAKAKGFRTGENPARWRGHLDHLLPPRQKLSRGHHAAMPFKDVPAFMGRLRSKPSVAGLALEFTVLTACRSGEVRGASWNEIDLEGGIWTIPASRMKARRVHRVPLCDRAIDILHQVKLLRIGTLVFPGQKPGSPLSDMSLSAVLRRMSLGHFTVHGFRSAFRDWAGEHTNFSREIAEAALAHRVGDMVEQAYRRGDSLEKRRELMREWGHYCASECQP